MVWADLPVGRAVRLIGAGPDELALTLVPLPDDAPAVMFYRPTAIQSVSAIVAEALDEMERAARTLFPVWLPGAERVGDPSGAGSAAVRALARQMAQSTTHNGRYLADLAVRSLRGTSTAPGVFSAETRAAGLARVLAEAYDRSSAALVVEAPRAIDAVRQERLVAAGEWLAQHGGLGVWFVGGELSAIGWLKPFRIRLPAAVDQLVVSTPAVVPEPTPPTLFVPPVAGQSATGSEAERLLEAALCRQPWASGRRWHLKYQPTPLDLLRFLDVVWELERVVVEIDGDEHRGRLKWADDRIRDNQLQREGYEVLRFPNERIANDLDAVLHDIETHLAQRRSVTPEGPHHAPHR